MAGRYETYCPGCGELHGCEFPGEIVWCPKVGWVDPVQQGDR